MFLREEERSAIEAVARERWLPFRGIWLDAPAGLLAERVAARRGDASDADAAVVHVQAAEDPGEIRWPHVDATEGPVATLARARRVL